MQNDNLFGLCLTSSVNIGDEIQMVAASRFLPHIDKFIHREALNKVKSKNKFKVLMNAWWMWRPRSFPPADCIEPLLISMHIRPDIYKKFFSKQTINYLKKHGPVGCRDKGTLRQLESLGIPAYFSGCLTLTLQRNNNIPKKEYIITVELPEKYVKEIQKRTNRPVYNISRNSLPCFTQKERLQIAKLYLKLYQSAHCVVSSCLHAALPCLALETPFLFFNTEDNDVIKSGRAEGLIEHCNIVNEKDFMENKSIYNFETPLPNPESYKEIRNDLILRCKNFTGFDNPNSLLDSDTDPFIELLQLLEYRYSIVKHLLWWAKPKDLVINLFNRTFLKKSRHDIIDL